MSPIICNLVMEGRRYRTFDIGIERSILVSIVRYRYRTFDTGMQHSISVSNVRYQCQMFDTGIKRSILVCNIRYRYRTFDTGIERTIPVKKRHLPKEPTISKNRYMYVMASPSNGTHANRFMSAVGRPSGSRRAAVRRLLDARQTAVTIFWTSPSKSL